MDILEAEGSGEGVINLVGNKVGNKQICNHRIIPPTPEELKTASHLILNKHTSSVALTLAPALRSFLTSVRLPFSAAKIILLSCKHIWEGDARNEVSTTQTCN